MPPFRCHICNKPFEPEQTPAMPFCSNRCRLVDLNRWLEEDYGLPYEPEKQAEEPETGE